MSLAQRAAVPTERRYAVCKIKTLLTVLPREESEALRSMLADRSWTHQGISEALLIECGQRITGQTIGRHRRGLCRCER